MTRFEKLMLAEELVQEFGSHRMFQKSYTDARQFYDVETSLKMALEQQDLLPKYIKCCEYATPLRNVLTSFPSVIQ